MVMISLSLMKMTTERSHLSTPCVVFVNVHFRVDAWQFSIPDTFYPQLSLKPPHFQDFLTTLSAHIQDFCSYQ